MAESAYHFAVKSIGLSRVNGRKPQTLLQAARHNLREIQAEQGASGHINPKRSSLNRILAGPPTAAEVQALAETLLTASDIDTTKLRRDHCQAIEVVFSLPVNSTINAANYFTACLDWLAVALPLPILTAVVHHDEAAPHLHVLMLPLLNRRHVGGSPIERAALKQMREAFFSRVAGPAGLKRDTAKLRGVVKQWAIDAVLKACHAQGLPEVNGPLWPVIVAAIERDPTAAVSALGIDLNSIRPDEPIPSSPKPIGIDSNPIGIATQAQELQSLSCVGIARPLYPEASTSDRQGAAREAQMQAISRHNKASATAEARHARNDDDGWTRERDALVNDTSAWAAEG